KAYVVYNMKMTPFTAPFETDDKRNILMRYAYQAYTFTAIYWI
ncbi:hypothetical protein HMPREF9541_04286, partial [Escherichia coli MS 116-1]